MEQIKDLDIYNARMQKSMYDKMWFVDKIFEDIDFIYDYGCGDGSLLLHIKPFFPNATLVGYDINPDMTRLAAINGIAVVSEPLDKVPSPNSLVIASSVFHEIYNYSDNIKRDYTNIVGIGAKYIAIRDMHYQSDRETTTQEERLAVLDKEPLNKVLASGNISNYKNFVHYLLKYRYEENWSRECEENYFAADANEIIGAAENVFDYTTVYSDFYVLPFLSYQVKKDFGIDKIDATTHYKCLLKRQQFAGTD